MQNHYEIEVQTGLVVEGATVDTLRDELKALKNRVVAIDKALGKVTDGDIGTLKPGGMVALATTYDASVQCRLNVDTRTSTARSQSPALQPSTAKLDPARMPAQSAELTLNVRDADVFPHTATLTRKRDGLAYEAKLIQFSDESPSWGEYRYTGGVYMLDGIEQAFTLSEPLPASKMNATAIIKALLMARGLTQDAPYIGAANYCGKRGKLQPTSKNATSSRVCLLEKGDMGKITWHIAPNMEHASNAGKPVTESAPKVSAPKSEPAQFVTADMLAQSNAALLAKIQDMLG